MTVDARTPDVGRLGPEGQLFLAGDVLEHAQRLGHDFRSDVIPGEYGELECRH